MQPRLFGLLGVHFLQSELHFWRERRSKCQVKHFQETLMIISPNNKNKELKQLIC